jgi:hypothetical protein
VSPVFSAAKSVPGSGLETLQVSGILALGQAQQQVLQLVHISL